MKYSLQICARPNLDERVTDKHARLMRGMARIKGDWGVQGRTPKIHEPTSRDEFGIWVKLKGLLGAGIRGDIFYSSRSYLMWAVETFGKPYIDHGSKDDRIFLEFDPRKVDFAALANGGFAELLEAMDAYLGKVYDQEFINIDHVKFEARVSSRHGVEHLSHMNYFDRQLCRRAFGLTPAQVVKRVKPHMLQARVERGGTLLITSHLVPDFSQSWETHARVMPLLTGRPVKTTKQVKRILKETAEKEAERAPPRAAAASKPGRAKVARTALACAVRSALRFFRAAAQNEDSAPAATERFRKAIAAQLDGCSQSIRQAILGKSAKRSRQRACPTYTSDEAQLARATILALQFIELAPDHELQDDTAVRGLELITAELQSVTSQELAELVTALQQLTAEEKAGSRSKKVLEFYDDFVESCGLNEVP